MFVRNAWYVAAWDHEVGRELQAMVGALDDVAEELPHRERRLAMAAAVFEGDRPAVGAPV